MELTPTALPLFAMDLHDGIALVVGYEERGLSRAMLEHLMTQARAAGFRRLSLETGVQPTFVAARTLYTKAGFADCPPFGSYAPDPNSVFMTRALV